MKDHIYIWTAEKFNYEDMNGIPFKPDCFFKPTQVVYVTAMINHVHVSRNWKVSYSASLGVDFYYLLSFFASILQLLIRLFFAS